MRPMHGLFGALLVASSWQATGDPQALQEQMVELAWKRGCFNCHDLETTIRGPAWQDVGARYRDDPEALERLVLVVRNGGGGNWGDDYMTANRRVPEEDIRQLVGWILTLGTTDPAEQQ